MRVRVAENRVKADPGSKAATRGPAGEKRDRPHPRPRPMSPASEPGLSIQEGCHEIAVRTAMAGSLASRTDESNLFCSSPSSTPGCLYDLDSLISLPEMVCHLLNWGNVTFFKKLLREAGRGGSRL